MAKSFVLGAVGDIEFDRSCGECIARHGPLWPFDQMLPHLRKCDLLIGNMESIILPDDYPEDLRDPAGLVGRVDGTPGLKAAGFDLMVMANNHVLDGGHVGMFHTQRLIERLGIATVGVGQTQAEARRMRVLECQGVRVGFLAYCEDTNYSLGTPGPCHAYYALGTVLEDIARNRSAVDVLVVNIHADLEFMETPSLPRRENARAIARAGADLVLMHHPHVPQGVEMIDGRLIAYSLGNFYFGAHSMAYMRENGPHTAHSFLLLAEVGKQGVARFSRVPFEIAPPPNERPAPLKGPARAAMLKYLRRLDDLAQDDAVVAANWRATALKTLDIYIDRIMGGKYSRQELLEDVLGRLMLVPENRAWVEEALRAVGQQWRQRADRVDPYHRPLFNFAYLRKKK